MKHRAYLLSRQTSDYFRFRRLSSCIRNCLSMSVAVRYSCELSDLENIICLCNRTWTITTSTLAATNFAIRWCRSGNKWPPYVGLQNGNSIKPHSCHCNSVPIQAVTLRLGSCSRSRKSWAVKCLSRVEPCFPWVEAAKYLSRVEPAIKIFISIFHVFTEFNIVSYNNRFNNVNCNSAFPFYHNRELGGEGK